MGFLGRVVDLPSWSQALSAALAGAAIAWAYFFGDQTKGGQIFSIAVGIPVGVMVLAWLSYRFGALVVGQRPLLGVRLMGLWAWLELAGGALGIAIGIWLAETVVPKEKEPSEATKAVVSGWAAGLSAAIATALSKRAEDADVASLAPDVKDGETPELVGKDCALRHPPRVGVVRSRSQINPVKNSGEFVYQLCITASPGYVERSIPRK